MYIFEGAYFVRFGHLEVPISLRLRSYGYNYLLSHGIVGMEICWMFRIQYETRRKQNLQTESLCHHETMVKAPGGGGDAMRPNQYHYN